MGVLISLNRMYQKIFDGLFDILDKIDNAFPWFFLMMVGLFILYHIVDKLLLPLLGGNSVGLGNDEVSNHSDNLHVVQGYEHMRHSESQKYYDNGKRRW